jgi:four helix bundle protein
MTELLDDRLPSVSALNEQCECDEVREERRAYGTSESTPSGYRGLRVWQVAIEYTAICYQVSKALPKDESYGLISQLRRAACSVGLNIAEGWGRNRQLELARYCDIAQGSLCESNAALELAVQLGYVSRQEVAEAEHRGDQLGAMLRKLAAAARSRAA